MEKGTSLRKDGGDVTQGGDTGQAGLPALPAPPPEQRGPQALVEARDSSAPQQVPGQLGGRGSRGGWRFHRGLGSPLGREPSMGSQDLFLGGWGERDSLLARPQHRRGGGGLAAPAPAPALTDAACVLELDLQHLHGGGHNHLAGARAAARQHLLQQRQLLPGREKVGPPGVSGSGGAEPPASDTPPASPATDTEPGRQTAHGQGLGRAVGHSIF